MNKYATKQVTLASIPIGGNWYSIDGTRWTRTTSRDSVSATGAQYTTGYPEMESVFAVPPTDEDREFYRQWLAEYQWGPTADLRRLNEALSYPR